MKKLILLISILILSISINVFSVNSMDELNDNKLLYDILRYDTEKKINQLENNLKKVEEKIDEYNKIEKINNYFNKIVKFSNLNIGTPYDLLFNPLKVEFIRKVRNFNGNSFYYVGIYTKMNTNTPVYGPHIIKKGETFYWNGKNNDGYLVSPNDNYFIRIFAFDKDLPNNFIFVKPISFQYNKIYENLFNNSFNPNYNRSEEQNLFYNSDNIIYANNTSNIDELDHLKSIHKTLEYIINKIKQLMETKLKFQNSFTLKNFKVGTAYDFRISPLKIQLRKSSEFYSKIKKLKITIYSQNSLKPIFGPIIIDKQDEFFWNGMNNQNENILSNKDEYFVEITIFAENKETLFREFIYFEFYRIINILKINDLKFSNSSDDIKIVGELEYWVWLDIIKNPDEKMTTKVKPTTVKREGKEYITVTVDNVENEYEKTPNTVVSNHYKN